MADDARPLFQEGMRGEPFWMFVGCVLVNRAAWAVARGAHATLRSRWPSAAALADADAADVEAVVRVLGFGSRRAASIVAMARAWIDRGPPRTRTEVLALPGLGPYAADSWEMFVAGRRDVEPTDRRLLSYLARDAT